MRFGSLFSGIGGLDLGLERAGMECAWQVEIDEYASRVLAKHWPHVARFRDVRECGAHNLPAVDLICGGFPCQPHSFAGKRQASQDARDMWPDFARIIRQLRPRWVLAENVPGILSSEDGWYFGGILRDLAQIGYDAEWHCLSACAVGAPHPRERLFIVAHANSERREEFYPATLSARQGQHTGQAAEGGDYWSVEPMPERVAHGVPHRVDRLRGLGNAVVPQEAEYLGRLILEADQQCQSA